MKDISVLITPIPPVPSEETFVLAIRGLNKQDLEALTEVAGTMTGDSENSPRRVFDAIFRQAGEACEWKFGSLKDRRTAANNYGGHNFSQYGFKFDHNDEEVKDDS